MTAHKHAAFSPARAVKEAEHVLTTEARRKRKKQEG